MDTELEEGVMDWWNNGFKFQKSITPYNNKELLDKLFVIFFADQHLQTLRYSPAVK